MNCQRCTELMMDILYGEDVSPRGCFEFFEHLGTCDRCRDEYLELLETREMLGEWAAEEIVPPEVETPSAVAWKPRRRVQWWPLMQKVAAGVLILVGAFSIVQSFGVLPSRNMVASEARLAEFIHDVTLAQREDDWRMIGEALLSLKEEVDAQNRLGMENVYQDMRSQEKRFVEALEESNRYVKTLITQ